MQEIIQQLELLQGKVERLIRTNNQIAEQNTKLKQEKIELIHALDEAKREATLLQENNKVLKLANAVSGGDQNTRELKLKINEYIKEIDRCLALINR